MRIVSVDNYGAGLLAKPDDVPAPMKVEGNLSNVAIRHKIQHLEATMRDMQQVECPLTHHFAPGAYARECLLPKGSLVVGKIHKHSHINIISKGRVSVLTEFGPMQITAPHTFVSQVGTKRVVYAHEDTVWTTVHVTSETDLVQLEKEIIAETYNDLDALGFIDAVLKLENEQ